VRGRVTVSGVAVVGFFVVLTACSGSGEDVSDPSVTTDHDTTAPSVADEEGTAGVVAPPQDAATERQRRFEAMAGCLTDKGFTSEASSDGVTTQVTEEQVEAFHEAQQQCQQEVNAELGADPATAVLTPEQLGEQYDVLLDVSECLSAAGYPVSAPPSREVWVESALLVQDVLQEGRQGENRAMDLPWNPYDEIDSVAAAEQCPIPLP